MIDTLNEEISKFLSSFLNTEDEKLSLIEKKCSSTITDDLDKGPYNLECLHDSWKHFKKESKRNS